MKASKIAVCLLSIAILLSGCGEQQTGGEVGSSTMPEASASVSGNASTPADTSDMFSDRDSKTTYDESASAYIQLNGNSATSSSDAVKISGSTVTITDEGTYVLAGTLDDGMIIVDSDDTDKTQLVLNGVTINSETSAPIYILESDKVFITLAEGSENTLSNGGSFVAIDENNIDAVIFSKADLTLNGSGSLVVNSPAGHGIVCKDDLVFTGGSYTVNSASHGVDANDSVRVAGASFTITSGKDGVRAENSDDATLGFVYIASGSFDIAAEGDGISAGAYLLIEDGAFDIVSGGGSANASQKTSDSWGDFMGGGRGPGGHGGGMGGPGDMGGDRGEPPNSTATDSTEDSTSIKAIKAAGDLTINGGTFAIDSADDSIHSNSAVTIHGGVFEIASGDDAFHADEAMTVNDGTIHITESYEGIEGLSVTIAGGDITIYASDDGLNAAGGTDSSGMGGMRGDDMFAASSDSFITISGGTLYINAGGDGVDSNGELLISGGDVIVSCPTTGDTAVLDYGSTGTITGGTFIGTGALQMAVTFSSSEQGVISVQVGNQSAGTEITLADSNGDTVMSHAADQSFAIVILSSPDMVKGEEYTITVGSASGTFTAS